MRIASLLASGTEIVCALDLLDELVAISHECDYPPEALDRPRVSRPRFDPAGLTGAEIDRAVRSAMADYGSVYELDDDALRRADPDLLLAQAVCEVCAVPSSLAERGAALLDGGADVVSLDAHSVEDVLRCIERVGAAAGVPERARKLRESLSRRLEVVRNRVAGAPRPRVLALEWLAPPFVPGHWVPEMVEIAGGTCVAGDVRRPSRELSWEGLDGFDPDVLIVMPCGLGLEASRREADRHAAQLERVARRAVRTQRAYVVDGSSFFNRSGPRIADGVEILGAILHAERLSRIDLRNCAAAWQPKELSTSR